MVGGAGDDRLIGGLGRDFMIGEGGADVFVFRAAEESKVGVDRSVILDFASGEDRIDLSIMDADLRSDVDDAFTFVGNAPLTGAGELAVWTSGASSYVAGDLDGDGNRDFVIFLEGVTSMTAADFIL